MHFFVNSGFVPFPQVYAHIVQKYAFWKTEQKNNGNPKQDCRFIFIYTLASGSISSPAASFFASERIFSTSSRLT